MKKIILVLKKYITAFIFLFGLNVVIKSLGIIIPINIFNVSLVAILGIPGILSILVIKLFII
jgi:pro-sigmaK processing inhibitor BofA